MKTWADNIRTRIGIEPRTPFMAMFRMHDGWRVWTAVRNMKAPYSTWEGTYLDLNDDGSCFRNTIYPDGTEDLICVKPART